MLFHGLDKLSGSDGENGETDTWLDFAHSCEYLSESDHTRLTALCSEIGAMLGSIMNDPSSFIVRSASDL